MVWVCQMATEILRLLSDGGGMLAVDWENVDFFMTTKTFLNKGF
jgi:hypothetical protein